MTPAERNSLSRDLIVHTAIDLADTHGVEAVTIRRVASMLGVTPMALYWHFGKKDDLLAGMVDWVFGQLDPPLDTGVSWEEQLRSLLEAELATLRAHPAMTSLMLSHESTSGYFLAAIERALAALRSAGFPPNEAVQIVQHAQQTVVNLVLRQPGRRPMQDSGEQEERERQMLSEIRALPPDQYPHIIEAAVPLSRCEDPEEYYRFGLDVLIAGICAMAERHTVAN